jgi:DNA/RNA endonuclease YhcR with UshA esterase domain
MEKIVKYSLICIVIGLGGLYLVSEYLQPEYVEIAKINKSYLNKIIQTSGKVTNSYLSNTSTLFLTLEDKGDILKVVKFKVEKIEFKKGDNILVKGELSLYKNELEIIARNIKKLN